jgi:hypothetical protein
MWSRPSWRAVLAKPGYISLNSQVPEGVPGLFIGHRAEQGGDLRVPLNVGLLGEIQVSPVRLALGCERRLEIVVGFGAF